MLNPATLFKYWTMNYRGLAPGESLCNLFACHTGIKAKQGLYICQKKKKGVWRQMPDMLLMELSGSGESRRAIE